MSVTVVAHPVSGEVITASVNNPEFGTFRVDSVEKIFNGRFFNPSKRTAFIHGKIEDLATLNLKAGMKLPGRIKKVESFQPFYDGQEPKINPTTGEIVLTDGEPTYLEYSYVQDANALDVFVEPDAATVAPAEVLEAQHV